MPSALYWLLRSAMRSAALRMASPMGVEPAAVSSGGVSSSTEEKSWATVTELPKVTMARSTRFDASSSEEISL